ncbi:MAG: SIMPL domain-containing protein [Caulobacteraceae bacterium]|nr:SIMPL domain-containing protein [Caulobacteraceae bacterium]
MNTPIPAGPAAGLLLAASALALPLALPGAAWADAPGADRAFEATTLSLSADGETQVAPDQATLNLGVQVTAPTAAEAMAQNAQQMTAVFAALRKAGLPERDVRTSNLSLSAQYTYAQDKPPVLNGYAASNEVTVTVNDIARLGPVIDAVTAAGANQVNGVSFGLKDSSAAEDAARLAAVKALSAKAALYAGATGYHVVRLINLSEGGGETPPGPVRPMALMKAATPTPVSAGQLSVQVTVTGVYELAK